MAIDDILNTAKGALGGDEGLAQKIDQAAEAIKDKTPDQVDTVVDKVADAAKGFVNKD